VFAPPVLSETTKYAANVFGEQIVADIGNKAENFATTEQAFGRSFTTGIDDTKLTTHVADKVKALDRNSEFNQAIAFNAFSKTLGSDTSFTTDKESEALTIYNPSFNDATVTIDGAEKRIGEIQSISPDGTVVYAVPDKEIENHPKATELTKWRQSKSEYVKELYTATKNNMPIKDESSDYEAYQKEKRRAEVEAKSEKAQEAVKTAKTGLEEAPALYQSNAGNWALSGVNSKVGDREISSVEFDKDGNVIAYSYVKAGLINDGIIRETNVSQEVSATLKNNKNVGLASQKVSATQDANVLKARGFSVSSQQVDYAPFNKAK